MTKRFVVISLRTDDVLYLQMIASAPPLYGRYRRVREPIGLRLLCVTIRSVKKKCLNLDILGQYSTTSAYLRKAPINCI